MRPRWQVTAFLVNDALGNPVDPTSRGASAPAGVYLTRWGARRAARAQAAYAAKARTDMNGALRKMGLATMQHRFEVTRISR